MVLFVCKCLNVSLESDKVEDNVDREKLELTSSEQRDIFFSEKLLSSPANILKTQIEQQILVGTSVVGRWTLHTCLACGMTVYALLQDNRGSSIVLINKQMQTTHEQVNSLKKSNNYSPVFNILVPELSSDIEMKENMDTNNFILNNKKNWPLNNQVIGTLSKQLNQRLESQLEAIEDTVRQFREQKYSEFEAYKERAQRDHKTLASIINKARSGSECEWRVDTSLDNGPPSPQLPPLQRRRLSSFKDVKKAQNIFKPNRNPPQEDDSLDNEVLFYLEDTDSRHNIPSDQDDYETDEESAGEGVQITRPRGGGVPEIARSLPMNMPKFPNDRAAQEQDYADDEEPHDIAASMKALARSVHGDAFELPRPRFSTQI